MVSISVFDIALIVDLICDPLDIVDLQVCCQVNRHWSIMFGPHRWKPLDLSSTTMLSRDQINGIIKNASYTRSVTIAWVHQSLPMEANFHHLHELTLRDEIAWNGNQHYHHNSVLALITRNRNMQSLTLDVDRCNYLENTFAASIMRAIAQHPSLTTLVWNVPSEVFGVGDSFVQSLLEATLDIPTAVSRFNGLQRLRLPDFQGPEEEALMYANKFGEGAKDRMPMTIKDLQSMGVKVQLTAKSSDDENGSFTEHDSDQEYTMAKARSRHYGLHDRKRRPFKK
ncbi:hypothetical protein BG006_009769 [Podila minutissima]|uniref:F-box domain-containing protein n=1 Tax=Podila minutissima TaxID=64525 RepID=A0A9P5SQH8_9FUNG|nr:hypothetical protein BG006_009769 [Podila minutissima]